MKNVLGQHLLVEFYNCNPDKLDQVANIETWMNEAALASGATIVQSGFHRFEPYGVSGVVVIAESHLAIHTWPEHRYASVDLFTCGDSVEPLVAYEYLKEKLEAKEVEIQMLKRGHLDRIEAQLRAAQTEEKELLVKGGVR